MPTTKANSPDPTVMVPISCIADLNPNRSATAPGQEGTDDETGVSPEAVYARE